MRTKPWLAALAGLLGWLGAAHAPALAGDLRADGAYFRDAAGGIVYLRGFNVAGDAKVPPFNRVEITPEQLAALPDLGANAIRLPFIWEAYEPTRGVYDEAYLARLVATAHAAAKVGLHVVVDFHQDAYSRFASAGCGSGFPEWTVESPVIQAAYNGSDCIDWGMKAFDLRNNMHKSWAAFYANKGGIRDAYLTTFGRVAKAFSSEPGVIGYDVLNEPWGPSIFIPHVEQDYIFPLYQDAAKVIRAEHPSAILFLEPHVWDSIVTDLLGYKAMFQTELPDPLTATPALTNVAYAPHFYESDVMTADSDGQHAWSKDASTMDTMFGYFADVQRSWNVPVLLGEFGMMGGTTNGMAYLDHLVDDVNANRFSALQWSYTPDWNAVLRDGWNREDTSIVDGQGQLRSNEADVRAGATHAALEGQFRRRPYVQRLTGEPTLMRETLDAQGFTKDYTVTWTASQAGEARLYAPALAFANGRQPHVEASGPGLVCGYETPKSVTLVCKATGLGAMAVTVSAGN